ncbi:carbon-nitrogen hydrolase family protein [Rhodococcus rhodnii]|uniref:Amidohydrolase, carbon-nitrogen hydrolase family n=2 Tax=Rhodococcus rhodnii TaxID=38312 RepID=R7WQ18_9NOCA|nr:carbon-nitrogen hydrolase family protein [Rhodococcus rhodnii]EOM77350.1 amidohydrolase, carbon-nitrogen hydrolase family [Rhodococcus rhodnii LMG 5362]TXG91724.1 carbon-nitrogen hydrolase family protein [Rhodococcus rhodnii]
MVEIAVAQFAPGVDKDENLRSVRALVADAAARGAHVVVTPEYTSFTAPRTDERIVAAGEPLDGPFVTGLAGIAAEHDVTLVTGVAESIEGEERVHNTLVAISPGGEIVARYRKLHLYDAFGRTESTVIAPGPVTPPETFAVDGLTFGMQTCYDLRFPEVTRLLVDAGADVVCLPAQWVPGPLKEDHWTTLVRARAIENTVYVAAADQGPRTGAGHSMIVDPYGIVVTALGEQTGTAVATVTRSRLDSVRTENPALELRRFAVTVRPGE